MTDLREILHEAAVLAVAAIGVVGAIMVLGIVVEVQIERANDVSRCQKHAATTAEYKECRLLR